MSGQHSGKFVGAWVSPSAKEKFHALARVLDQSVAQTKARNAKVAAADIEAVIHEALQTVCAEGIAAAR